MEDEDAGSLGTVNDDEFTEFDHDISEPPVRGGIVADEEEVKKRGRPRIEEKWTRVMAIESDRLLRVNLPTVASDLKLASATIEQHERGDEDAWEPHFHPKVFAKEHPRMKIEDYIIEPDQLKTLGVKLTKMRKNIRDVALEQHRQDALFLEEDIHDVTVLAAKLNRGYFRGQKRERDAIFRDFVVDTAPMSRYWCRQRWRLTPQEKISIVHKVLVGNEMRKDVAKEFRVSPTVVSKWVQRFKQEGHLQQLVQAEEQAEVKLQVVKTMVECMLL